MVPNVIPSFEFKNNVSPRYIAPLLIQLEYGRWYDTGELKNLLRTNGLDVEGSKIVQSNTSAWSLAGLGEVRAVPRPGRISSKLFRLTSLGKQIIDTYSTNHELFYDLVHFIFYSTWHRSKDVWRARFWLYASVCDALWLEAPSEMDSFVLTNRLQAESQKEFPDFAPAFPERSVGAVFPWLGALSPPFLSKCGTKSQLCSRRRSYCTPQLFHLATDLVYTVEGLKYGTSMALDERHIETICKVCLLDVGRFWQMADLTKAAIRGFDIRKGQWGTSLALDGPPAWIDLPNFAKGQAEVEVAETDEGSDE
jgi:hypothetical protein